MSYLVLARKYRPRKFSELVGQEHVTQTLMNAFRQNKVGQAYLFTGTRGVGKTSVGRLLAKALRCEHPDSQPGMKNYGIPCDECSSCLEVGQAGALDVVEIDGASNNGVDNVRDLRDSVKFHPSRGRMKVYIIDEVHMLTGAAFNALLKTLEEPPAHAVFLFATTEAHKVPATILSRCQRFDLKRVPQPVLFNYLQQIATREEIKAEPDALLLIARKAEGSIRDSLSLLDQALALSGKNLSLDQAAAAIGIIRSDLPVEILKAAFTLDSLGALRTLEAAYESGVDLKNLAIAIAETLRNLLLVKLGAENALLGVLQEERKSLETVAGLVGQETLEASFQSMSQAVGDIARSPFPRAVLELALLRLPQFTQLRSVTDALARLGQGAVSAPTGTAEKKQVSTLSHSPAMAPPATPAAPASIDWKSFVSFAMGVKPSLGALLEQALALNAPDKWKAESLVKIGFRDNQKFYHDQAKTPAMQAQIEAIAAKFLGQASIRVAVEMAEPVPENRGLKSIGQSKAESRQEKIEVMKKNFLGHDLTRDTREIFGAELTAFDIKEDSVNKEISHE